MAKKPADKASKSDPLKKVADALDRAVKATKGRSADAKAAAEKAFPGASRFLSRLVYTTSYTFAYGVVFPTAMIARAIPANSSVAQGLVDGARAASAKVDELTHRPLELPAKPPPSPPKPATRRRKTGG